VLSDIYGLEDHLGDMDFKVAGTPTASPASGWMRNRWGGHDDPAGAIEQAREGPLDPGENGLGDRHAAHSYPPRRTFTIRINPDKIREVIGPGGKVIAASSRRPARTSTSNDGRINMRQPMRKRRGRPSDHPRHYGRGEIGKIYRGKVKKIPDFGAFVEIMPVRTDW
jgi:polyribonucleotide nucleotidyltransferase